MALLLLTNGKARGALTFTVGLVLAYIVVGFIVIFSSLPTDHPYIMWGLVPLAVASAAAYADPLIRIAGIALSTAADSVVPGSGQVVAAVAPG